MSEEIKRSFYDGKYTVIYQPAKGLAFMRHDEPWPAYADGKEAHNNLIRHMLFECCEADAEILSLRAERDAAILRLADLEAVMLAAEKAGPDATNAEWDALDSAIRAAKEKG